jgi:hypothetical protein
MIRKCFLGISLASFVCVAQMNEAYQPSSPMLSCRPRTLAPGGTLTLRFGFPHPGELAIRAPDGTWFFLVYDPDETRPAQFRPLIDKDAFRKLRELVIPSATAVGSPWVKRRDKNELIFPQPGEYQVELTEILETDADLPRYRCNILYKR